MDAGAVLIAHLVELINQTHACSRVTQPHINNPPTRITTISQHQSPPLQRHLQSDRVLVQTCSQTCRTRTLARGVHRTRRRLFHVFEELTLGRACSSSCVTRVPLTSTNRHASHANAALTGVTQQQQVDIAPDPVLSLHLLSHPSKHAEQQRGLDVIVAVDGGRNGGNETREYVGAVGECGEDGTLFFRDVELKGMRWLGGFRVGGCGC